MQPNTSRFNFLGTFSVWRTKINYRRFLDRLSNNLVTPMIIQIHFETKILMSTKVIWEREKRGFISYLSAWGSNRRFYLKNPAQLEKLDKFMKNGSEGRDVLGYSRKLYCGRGQR